MKAFLKRLRMVESGTALMSLMDAMCHELGFRYFAIIDHDDLRVNKPGLINFHRYPPVWADHFIQQQLYRRDPVVQACGRTCAGFAWSELPRLIYLNADHRDILERAAREGLAQGITVPVAVTGERRGSCSLAGPRHGRILDHHFLIGQLTGAFAFEAARRLANGTAGMPPAKPVLNRRQRQCTLLAGLGKTDWEIAGALGLERNTVIRYLAEARARYGVSTRQQLVICALVNGEISLSELA